MAVGSVWAKVLILWHCFFVRIVLVRVVPASCVHIVLEAAALPNRPLPVSATQWPALPGNVSPYYVCPLSFG